MGLNFYSDQKVKASLTKILGDGWYTRASIKYDRLPGHFGYVRLLLAQEKPNSRLTIRLQQREKELSASLGFIKRF